jgi:hypothetical protein
MRETSGVRKKKTAMKFLKDFSAKARCRAGEERFSLTQVMWNYFGLPGRSIENSWTGLLIVGLVICLFLLTASVLYLAIE